MKVVSCLLATVLLASVHLADAQQPKKIPQIGWIALFSRNSPHNREFVGVKGPGIMAFVEGLRERGYIEGQNIVIQYRSADYQSPEGREERLSEIAAELVRLKVDAIVADTNAATRAARKATTMIPTVFIYGDPVWDGLVPTLANPGQNLTGLSLVAPQLAGKRLEVLKQTFATISRVGVLLNGEAAVHKREFAEMQSAAEALRVKLHALEFGYSKQDLTRYFSKQ